LLLRFLPDIGSDEDACDLTIAAKIACDITHLGDPENFSILLESQLFTMRVMASALIGGVSHTTALRSLNRKRKLMHDPSIFLHSKH
jgi:hypothetical protein